MQDAPTPLIKKTVSVEYKNGVYFVDCTGNKNLMGQSIIEKSLLDTSHPPISYPTPSKKLTV